MPKRKKPKTKPSPIKSEEHKPDLDDAERIVKDLMSMGSLDLICALAEGCTFFYPSCGFDWDAIRNYSDRCSVFLYCDWHMTLDQLEQEMRGLLFENPARNALRCDWTNAIDIITPDFASEPLSADPDFLTSEERGDYDANYTHWANKKPWGRFVNTIHTFEGVERPVKLIYLCAEGVATYRMLFDTRAPKFLCIKRCGNGFGFNWTDYNDWNAPLGRAVVEGAKDDSDIRPEFVITERDDHSWPWRVEARCFTEEEWEGSPKAYRKISQRQN